MKLFTIFVFLLGIRSVCGELCADNCFCTEDEAECTLTSCSLLQLETSYGSLVINGFLCPEQRQFLEEIVDNTFIDLKDDQCGYIPNCRQVQISNFYHKIFVVIVGFNDS